MIKYDWARIFLFFVLTLSPIACGAEKSLNSSASTSIGSQLMSDALYTGRPNYDDAIRIDTYGRVSRLAEHGLLKTILGIGDAFTRDSSIGVQQLIDPDAYGIQMTQNINLRLIGPKKHEKRGKLTSTWTVSIGDECPASFLCQNNMRWSSPYTSASYITCFFKNDSNELQLVPYAPLAGASLEQFMDESGEYGPYSAKVYRSSKTCDQIADLPVRSRPRLIHKDRIIYKISVSNDINKKFRFDNRARIPADFKVRSEVKSLSSRYVNSKKLKLYYRYEYFINDSHDIIVRMRHMVREKLKILGGYIGFPIEFELCSEKIGGTINIGGRCILRQ